MTTTTTTTTSTTEYALVTLGRGTATHVAGWAADTTRCVNDWNLGRRVVRTHAAGTGRPTCKKCLHSVEAGEASAAAAAPAIAEAVAEIAAEVAAEAAATLLVPADGHRELTDPEWDAVTNLPTCTDCGAYPGSVEQESGRVLCLGCGRELNARPEIAEPYTARFNDDGEAEYGFAPQPAQACYHPRSCATCQQHGEACGTHHVGDSGHVDCTGDPALEWHGTAPRTYQTSALDGGNTRATVTDIGSGVWSWRVSRLPGRAGRSWFPRTIVWGTTSGRAAAQAAAEQALAAMPKVN